MLILIAGESGIGKTTLIDWLLKNYESYFEQPICYTSRRQRNQNERYTFVKKEQLLEAYNRGELLNLDEVFGYFYGISKKSTTEILGLGKHAIKEVHPDNFKKFEKSGLEFIRVLIVNKHLSLENQKFTSRENRNESYIDYESITHKYDITLNISGLTPAEAADALVIRVFLFITSGRKFPHPSQIDSQNRAGYDKVAHEFYDEFRITTKNFHDASVPFWEMVFESTVMTIDRGESTRLLEVGSGNGWLFNTFQVQNGLCIDCLDISTNMNTNYGEHKFVASSRCIPVKSNYYDYVVGSLCDPFLYPESIVDIYRVLKPTGFFILTYPSNVWADGLPLRGRDSTVFSLQNAQKAEVFSFCDFESFFEEEGKEIGFAMLFKKSYYLGEEYEDNVAEAINISAANQSVSPLRLPILTAIICRKN